MRPTANSPANKYSKKELEDILKDVMDPNKVLLHCGQHGYVASETPPAPIGCMKCWEAYWWHKIATTPPYLRKERLEAAYKSVYDAVKMHERGEFDFEAFEHPVVVQSKEPD